VTQSGLSKEEETRHFEMMKILKARPERYLLRSVFEDLKNWTAGKYYGPRGYLVTTDGRPASYEYLAAQLHMNVEDLKQAIPILTEIGLIERVLLNGSPARSGQGRTHPVASGSKHRPLTNGKAKGNSKTKTKNKGKTFGKSKANEQGASKRQSGVTARAKENGNGARRKANAQERHGERKRQGQSQGAESPPMAAESSHPPTTTPPLPSEPHGADALGGSKVIPFTAIPQGSVKPDSGRQRRATAAGEAKSYNKYDLQFGTKVYIALGYQWDIESQKARREICSFASKWAQCRQRLSDLPPPVLDELGRRAIAEAGKISKRRSNRNKAAVWCTVLDKLTNAKLAEAM
jgi:hypothetical protein